MYIAEHWAILLRYILTRKSSDFFTDGYFSFQDYPTYIQDLTKPSRDNNTMIETGELTAFILFTSSYAR
jgi:hypothetical protein